MIYQAIFAPLLTYGYELWIGIERMKFMHPHVPSLGGFLGVCNLEESLQTEITEGTADLIWPASLEDRTATVTWMNGWLDGWMDG